MKSRKLWYVIALSALFFVAARIAMAQGQAPPPDPSQAQGPAPGAARISIINGEVSVMRGDSGDWVAAVVNAPVVQGDAVATAERSRAELQLDFANVLRLDQNADVKIADLAQKHIQIQVASGIIDYVVFRGTEADAEIDTPIIGVHPLGEGVYRIQTDADSQTELTVRNGRAEVFTTEGSVTVERGQVIYIRGMDNPEYQIANAAPIDEWDRWNDERDRKVEEARSWQYTNRYYTGSQDLDQYGQWEYAPDYGYVWAPNVGPDWEPYYNGNWEWEPYWGWTWVSFEPWGWAPYHYGRWCWWGNRWCWWPGIGFGGPRPLWAPAYVSFLGFGFGARGFGFGLGFGSIGWLPLGPFERPFPWWGQRNGYTAVNITNITHVNTFNGGRFGNFPGRYTSNLQAALTNPNIRRAITTMPADRFGKGAVRGFARGVDAATLREGRMVQGTLPVVPTRASLMPGNRLASPSAIPSRAINNTRFYSRNPVPARPESFNQRAAQIQQMVRQNPLGTSNYGARPGPNTAGRFGNAGGASGGFGNANRPEYANPRQMPPSTQGQSGNSSRGRFSSPSPYTTTRPQAAPAGGNFQPRYGVPQAGSNQSGWQRFPRQGQPGPATGGRGWNAASPRSQSSAPSWGRYSYGSQGRSYGGYGSRPTLNIRKPIVVERPAPRSYGGGRGYSAPSGGSRSAPSPSRGGGGGGGSHSRR